MHSQRSRTMAGSMMAILIPIYLVFYGTVIAGINACDSIYVRPPAGLSSIRNQILAANLKKSATEPGQMHVSLAGPEYMKVSWMTADKSVPAIVEYGTQSGNLLQKATGVSKSYTFLTYQSGQMHHVKLGPLLDSTTYFYRCGGFGPEYNFTTPPPSGPSVPIKFAVVGDLGQTDWTASTLQHVAAQGYDVLLFAGDLSYADYIQPRWDTFGQMMSPYANYKPWMVTHGNHEEEQIPLLVKSFLAFNTRWEMPYNESGSNSNLYYSFEVAGVHVLMLGSYAEFDSSSAQYKWLQADLAKVDRTKTPWLIAMLHAPWYNSNTAHQGETESTDMMAAMETLLYQHNVDILFAGHVHAYERNLRVYKNQLNDCGIVHITIGDGGNREGLATNWKNPQPTWSVKRESSFGFGRFNVVNATHALWSWHRNQDVDAVMADEVWLTNLAAIPQCTNKAV
ncbi:hypothetical protein KC19_12G152000 [Ceratodon purpureus]|nr:hypothetical protein KC19_12G152000 [Ceratodon purpureus]KAG0555202.1 hypothetical protein KC19_12G152000 [Ceratodon purpureus]